MNYNKTYIPDTNIAIDDAYFLRTFLKDKENKVVIPDVVLGELDKLKKNPEVGHDVREFISYFYKLIETNPNISKGIEIPLTPDGVSKGGKLYITNKYALSDNKDKRDVLTYAPNIGENDLNIIRAAAVYQKDNPDENVVLVSNDKNVVSIARINGINAEYMRNDSTDPSKLSQGYRLLDVKKGLEKYILGKESIKLGSISEPWADDLIANEYVVFMNDAIKKMIEESRRYDANMEFSIDPHFVKRYDIQSDSLVPLQYTGKPIRTIAPRNLEQVLFIDQLLNDDIHIKVVRADAGTGKSFLELLVALDKTINRRKNKKEDAQVLIIRRSAFLEDYGFLPGDMVEKNRRTYDGIECNYDQIMEKFVFFDHTLSSSYSEKFSEVLKDDDGLVKILPFGTIRGMTVGPDSIVVCEEWQNTEVKFSKILMDRNGNGEVYINGDFNQTDNPHTSLERNGLAYLMRRIQDVSKKARSSRDELDLYDASITGIMTLNNSERGIISAWSNRNLSGRSR